MIEHHRPFAYSVCLLLGICLTWGPARAADPAIDSLMDAQPVLTLPRESGVLSPGMVDLWLQALARPEVELQYQAALALIQARHQGLPGLEKVVPKLIQLLNKPEEDRTVRETVAQALVDLEARNAADSLWKQAQADLELGRAAEPALARWHYQPAATIWLARLRRGDKGQEAVLAIRGLSALRAVQAVPLLRTTVHATDQPAALRIEAARALGTIQPSGLEEDARQLLSAPQPKRAARLAAVCLLRHHQGSAAVLLLQQALHDRESAVVRTALARLMEIDPKTALPALDSLLASPSADVRQGAVEVLFHEITSDRLPLLAQCCADPHPEVRRLARRRLGELASRHAYHEPILQLAVHLLKAPNWRGQEQAALLLGQLDCKPIAGRLVELLRSARAEVRLAAAWGLRKLSVPSTLPAALAYVRDLHHEITTADGPPGYRESVLRGFDEQMSQLIQLLGKCRYLPADPVLRTFLSRLPRTPRPPVRGEARAAAVWALGLMHESKPDPALAKELARRLVMVFTPAGGDDPHVTKMFVISLVHMKATAQMPAIREYWQKTHPGPSAARAATIWASGQLTNQPFPPDPAVQHVVGGWFLSPVDPAAPRKR